MPGKAAESASLDHSMRITQSGRDFETTVRPEMAVLYRVARRMCGSDSLAEDMVSQTLLKAFRAWQRFDGQYVRSWLIKILRNEVLNQRRTQLARPQEAELEETSGVTEGFWDQVNWKLAGERILLELNELPSEFRMAVQLCDVEQLSYEEAAAAMDVPIGTVRSRLFRGRARLRDRLAEFMSEESTP